jgi:hypothetical protein
VSNWFTSARRLHEHGGLGLRPRINGPGAYRRGRHGWINLAELVRLAGLPAFVLVQRYFAFTDQPSRWGESTIW